MKLLKTIKKLFKPSNKYTKKIFIENCGFENRGDQLMIISVMDQIRKYEPNAQILVRRHVFEQNPTFCIQNKLYPLELKNSGIRCSRVYSWVVNTLLREEWINTPREVDLILNCRGYYIADSWIKDEYDVASIKSFYKQFNKKGRRLIMLPQAFGPFENAHSKNVINFIYGQADIIYAREQQSYEYLSQVCPNTDKIKVIPDFTCLCPIEQKPSIQLPKKSYVLVIPNARMMDKTAAGVSNAYFDFLIRVVEFLRNNDEHVYLLNHEGEGDELLLHSLNSKLEEPLPICTNLTGPEIKALIKDCKLLISARYHGVVSGLTQGVPTLCTSWSHKYGELLKEHKCDINILEVSDIEASLTLIREALANPTDFSSKEGCEEKVEKAVTSMWQQVFVKNK